MLQSLLDASRHTVREPNLFSGPQDLIVTECCARHAESSCVGLEIDVLKPGGLKIKVKFVLSFGGFQAEQRCGTQLKWLLRKPGVCGGEMIS